METEKEIKHIIDLMVHDENLRRKITRTSFRYFFGTYLSHYIDYTIAPFHAEMFHLAEDPIHQTITIMAARNSAKSAILNTALAIWSVLGAPEKKMVIIVSRTQAKAKQHFQNIKREFESNKLLRNDLGPFRTEESQWGSSIILTKYDAQITFASTEQSLRGMRYKQYRTDLLILDDIEDDESVKTLEGRNKTYDWVTMDAIPSGNLPNLRIVLLGTLLHEDSIMMRFKKEIEAGKRSGVYREYPLIDASGNILWKSKYPDMDAVEAERKRIGNDRAWHQEFLLHIVSSTERVIHPEWIQYYHAMPPMTHDNQYRGSFIGVDLAWSESETSDKTAMVVAHVFGWREHTRIYIAPNPVNEHLNSVQGYDMIKVLADTTEANRRAKIYIEGNGYQVSAADRLQLEGYNADSVISKGDKRSRLAVLSSYIKNGTVLFADKGNETLISQITNLGNERYDDLCDAFSLVASEVPKSNKGYHPFSLLPPKRPPEKGDDGWEQWRESRFPITRGWDKMKF
ncbi:MAG: phage terminase large subunit family protein [Patescibacteria group bacterium]|nr:phage terminase large subunit family protein [Patescibacteria group bacterium]